MNVIAKKDIRNDFNSVNSKDFTWFISHLCMYVYVNVRENREKEYLS